jgi:hypothetical protein
VRLKCNVSISNQHHVAEETEYGGKRSYLFPEWARQSNQEHGRQGCASLKEKVEHLVVVTGSMESGSGRCTSDEAVL